MRLGLRHSVKVEGRLNFVQTALEPLSRGAVYSGEAIERNRPAWLAGVRLRASSGTRTRFWYRCRGCRRSTDPQWLHIANRFLP